MKVNVVKKIKHPELTEEEKTERLRKLNEEEEAKIDAQSSLSSDIDVVVKTPKAKKNKKKLKRRVIPVPDLFGSLDEMSQGTSPIFHD